MDALGKASSLSEKERKQICKSISPTGLIVCCGILFIALGWLNLSIYWDSIVAWQMFLEIDPIEREQLPYASMAYIGGIITGIIFLVCGFVAFSTAITQRRLNRTAKLLITELQNKQAAGSEVKSDTEK